MAQPLPNVSHPPPALHPHSGPTPSNPMNPYAHSPHGSAQQALGIPPSSIPTYPVAPPQGYGQHQQYPGPARAHPHPHPHPPHLTLGPNTNQGMLSEAQKQRAYGQLNQARAQQLYASAQAQAQAQAQANQNANVPQSSPTFHSNSPAHANPPPTPRMNMMPPQNRPPYPAQPQQHPVQHHPHPPPPPITSAGGSQPGPPPPQGPQPQPTSVNAANGRPIGPRSQDQMLHARVYQTMGDKNMQKAEALEAQAKEANARQGNILEILSGHPSAMSMLPESAPPRIEDDSTIECAPVPPSDGLALVSNFNLALNKVFRDGGRIEDFRELCQRFFATDAKAVFNLYNIDTNDTAMFRAYFSILPQLFSKMHKDKVRHLNFQLESEVVEQVVWCSEDRTMKYLGRMLEGKGTLVQKYEMGAITEQVGTLRFRFSRQPALPNEVDLAGSPLSPRSFVLRLSFLEFTASQGYHFCYQVKQPPASRSIGSSSSGSLQSTMSEIQQMIPENPTGPWGVSPTIYAQLHMAETFHKMRPVFAWSKDHATMDPLAATKAYCEFVANDIAELRKQNPEIDLSDENISKLLDRLDRVAEKSVSRIRTKISRMKDPPRPAPLPHNHPPPQTGLLSHSMPPPTMPFSNQSQLHSQSIPLQPPSLPPSANRPQTQTMFHHHSYAPPTQPQATAGSNHPGHPFNGIISSSGIPSLPQTPVAPSHGLPAANSSSTSPPRGTKRGNVETGDGEDEAGGPNSTLGSMGLPVSKKTKGGGGGPAARGRGRGKTKR
ncbi:hypothetical protein BT69DRAFT_1296212 [Atractiella rhizophila]|nr:hypothetical protein BT69DRAFT_1296212 [Atractiella rhizophila]